jgi:hypothetical protein
VTALAFSLALASSAPTATQTPLVWSGRFLTTDKVHLGIRGAFYLDNEGEHGMLEVGAGATFQVTASVISL